MKKQEKQSAEERRRLMELHKDHDEKVHGVRPDIVLDATDEDADWLHRQRDRKKP